MSVLEPYYRPALNLKNALEPIETNSEPEYIIDYIAK